MKYQRRAFPSQQELSRPARGAWVEIRRFWVARQNAPSRAPQGARGLKFDARQGKIIHRRSRPARGAWVEITLARSRRRRRTPSRPARGAWVEISTFIGATRPSAASRPARGAWVEIRHGQQSLSLWQSRPVRGAWVEIGEGAADETALPVAPRKGRVG